ncbi:MAG: hypothetical protein JJE45_00395 [Prolixibacteraceae bacterium]|nr:hypothetical protein [Prolixibacteraceae bacterium]
MLFKTIFKKIYESEINCRIEWIWDGGFTWSIQDNKFPRIWNDDMKEGKKQSIEITASAKFKQEIEKDLSQKDWIARGKEMDLEDALCKMYDAIIFHFPNSKAAKWLSDFDKNREHFFVCAKCGDLVDKRDLGNVFEHEHDDWKFPKIDSSKIIAKREGDNKAWNKGKQIDLN